MEIGRMSDGWGGCGDELSVSDNGLGSGESVRIDTRFSAATPTESAPKTGLFF
jgi:hypothetical protein